MRCEAGAALRAAEQQAQDALGPANTALQTAQTVAARARQNYANLYANAQANCSLLKPK